MDSSSRGEVSNEQGIVDSLCRLRDMATCDVLLVVGGDDGSVELGAGVVVLRRLGATHERCVAQ